MTQYPSILYRRSWGRGWSERLRVRLCGAWLAVFDAWHDIRHRFWLLRHGRADRWVVSLPPNTTIEQASYALLRANWPDDAA